MRCAVVNENGDVVNVIVANPETDPAPAGFLFVSVRENSSVEIGWKYSAESEVFICTLIEPRGE